LAVTLLGVWLGIAVNKANKQRRAVTAIERLGAKIQFDYELDATGQRIPDAQPPGPAWLRKFLGDDYFRKVIGIDFAFGTPVGRSKVVDADLSCLESLPDLEWIYLDRNVAVTDRGLVHLRNLTNLRGLSMCNTKVTGTGILANTPHLRGLSISHTPLTHDDIAAISKMQSLESLSIGHTPISDEDLAALASLWKLQLLQLEGTEITDAGLVHLERLTALDNLWLPTGISDDAVNRLRKALPNCMIHRIR
jgi:hypothetical protein